MNTLPAEPIHVTVGVYHLDRGYMARGSFSKFQEFRHVASVLASIQSDTLENRVWALALAFQLTNNIHDSWSLKPDPRVEVFGELPIYDGQQMGYRSTSVDDRMCVTINGIDTWYDVAPIGFEEVIF